MTRLQDIPGQILQSAQDSVPADSVSAIGEIGAEVTEIGQLIVRGEWALAWTRFSEGAVQSAIDFGPRVLAALFVGGIFYVVYRIIFRIVERILKASGQRGSAGFRDLVLNTIRFVGLALVALVALAQLGLDITAAVAGLGILGLALGFAAKDSLENFLAGVTIIMDRPFDVGDVIEVEGVYGTVTRFTLRSTRVKTVQNRILIMPNIGMINQALINHSAQRFVRVDVAFGIAYKEDIDHTREVVLAAVVRDDERLVDKIDPQVVVTELADSSVNMQLRLFVRDAANQLQVRWEYLERVRKALAAADIEIPFPHLQLFIDEAKAFEGTSLGRSGRES
ncbi:MAG: mechanosensitive ion channel family protein [Gemmatimonadota bacterium]|nr:mechanosensitive ion channel family protein [Gemmatimonadota bacterium]